MCKHKNIVVIHYVNYVNEETNGFMGCEVRCYDCDTYLFKSKDKGYKLAYEYIENNKDKFDTLFDYTCDDLNKKFNIKNGFNFG